jgi:hypothetical protein
MKRLNLVVFIMALVIAGTANAQNVDEVVNKHIEAIGGKEKWRTINSLKSEASLNVQGTEIPITLHQLHNKAFRQDYTVMNMNAFSLIRVDSGWNYMPFQGQTSPEPLTAEALKIGQEQLDIQGDLLDYAAKGNKVELLGKEELEGTEVFKIKLTKKSGNEVTQFIDTKTYYLFSVANKLNVNGQEMEMKTNYSNFQKLPEGIVVPFTMESSALPAPMIYKKYEVNPSIPESVFKLK